MRRRRTSTRSSSGRRRSPSAATATRTACRTRSGRKPGPRSGGSRLTSQAYEAAGGHTTARRRLSAAFWRRPWLRATALLSAPLAVFLLIFLAGLAGLFVSAFWSVDGFTGKVVHSWTLDNFREIFGNATYR